MFLSQCTSVIELVCGFYHAFIPWSAKCNLKIMGGTNNRLSWGRSKENLFGRTILLFQEIFREFCVLFCFVLTSNGS